MSLAAYSVQQPKMLSAVLKAEINPNFTRATGILLGGSGAAREVAIGQVLAKRLFGAPIGAAGANTGDGGIGTIALASLAKIGVYFITCIATAANGGRFEVVDPDGLRLADALVGTAYLCPQIGFTISDGGADFIVGDSFTITVPEGDKKLVSIDFAAVDGTQRADSIAAKAVTAPDGVDVPISTIDFGALVSAADLIWPAGATDSQKAAALSVLAAKHIIARATA